MERRVGDLEIESIAAETPKFTAPIVLVHGLWCRATVWHKFMGYLAHRGWTCHALNLRGHSTATVHTAIADVTLAEYLDDVRQVIAASEAPPIIMGHDLGGLLALQSARHGARAVVALAPLSPRAIARDTNRAVFGWSARLATWRRVPLPPPRGKIAAEYFAEGPPGGTLPESSRVARELREITLRLSTCGPVPALVLGAERDPFCPPIALQQLAHQVGAAFQTAQGATHAMPWERGWEQRVAETHRWLVQTLGEPLLAFADEEGTDD